MSQVAEGVGLRMTRDVCGSGLAAFNQMGADACQPHRTDTDTLAGVGSPNRDSEAHESAMAQSLDRSVSVAGKVSVCDFGTWV